MKMLRGRTMATGAALDCLFAICIQGDVLVPESEQKANNELLTFVYFCRNFVAFCRILVTSN